MSSPAGVIHDIGYRRYTGERLGRGYATWSLYVHSLRSAWGLGRGAVAKISPWLWFALITVYAAILVAIQSFLALPAGERLKEYYDFPGDIQFFVLIFVAIAAPELVSRDLRSGVLSLYFSRPLTRTDYPAAKWAAVITSVFLLLAVPELVLFLGTAFSQDGLTAVWHEFQAFAQGLTTSAITALLFGSIALLVSSLVGRRLVAAAITVGLFIISTPIWLVLQVIAYTYSAGGTLTETGEQIQQLSGLVSPFTIVSRLSGWLFNPDDHGVGPFGPVYVAVAAGIVVLCVLLTLLRYRKVAR